MKMLLPLVAICEIAFASSASAAGPVPPAPLATFGTTVTLPSNDDGYLQVPLGFSIKFGASTFSSTWVNNNGNLSFENYNRTWVAETFGSANAPALSIIAPFFQDVDTRFVNGGVVNVGSGNYYGHQAFAVTWDGVARYARDAATAAQDAARNSFQVILTNRSDTGAGNFDIFFNYQSIGWVNSSAPSGYKNALEGFQTADKSVFYSNPNSFNSQQADPVLHRPGVTQIQPTSLTQSSNMTPFSPGQYYFAIRDGIFNASTSAVPEPSSWAMMIGGLGMIGAAMRRQRIKARRVALGA